MGEGARLPAIPGYSGLSFARPRAYQGGRTTRGGIACYYRDSIAPHIRDVSALVADDAPSAADPTKSFAVLRVDKAAGFARDLYIVVTYVVPIADNGISTASRGVWDALTACVQWALERGHVLVVGDQNARTRVLPDFPDVIMAGEDQTLLSSGPTRALRRSQDTGEPNSHGRNMLAMCKGTGLRIANGRSQGDTAGAYTYLSPSGDGSVVDYALACPATMALLCRLRVVPAPCSDHNAVVVHLALEGPGSRRAAAPEPRPLRMGGAAIEPWAQDVLPLFAAELEAIRVAAPIAAASGAAAFAPVAERFEKVLADSYAQVQASVRRSGPRQPRWFDGELARGRKAALAAMRHNPRSARALQLRREYQRLLRRKQRRFKREQNISLVRTARENPKAFWQRYKTRDPASAGITKDQWSRHFSTLLGERPESVSGAPVGAPAAAPVGSSWSPRSADGSMLNSEITADDVTLRVAGLRKGSATLGLLSVEALRAAAQQLAPCVAALLNGCTTVGSLPKAWAITAITPVLKGGDASDPGNYRGIAVGTVLAKLYASLIHSRLSQWAESNGLRAAGQAGFREDHRCSDHLLTLRTIIEQQRVEKRPLYVCFVDFRKAYDSVPRELLWSKLERLGVHGWCLDSIKALYGSVPMAVKTSEGLTDTFECVMGVKQGCPLSPTLFGLYLDDFEHVLDSATHVLDLPSLAGRRLPALLYADDLALASTSPSGLQAQLDVLDTYAAQWGLTVNIAKTKAVVFRNKASQVYPLPLVVDGETIEVVDSFRYLGIDLHCAKPMAAASASRKESAERAQLGLRSRCTQLGIVDPALRVQLWDALVRPTMLYGVELWGARDTGKGELAGDLVHRDFLRRLLGVRSGTPNMAVLAEVGRYPLHIFAAKMLCKFWNRMVVMEEGRLVKQAFRASVALASRTPSNSTHKSWAGQVVSFLASLGLPHDPNAPRVVDVKAVVEQLQCSYLASVTGSQSSKVQQYLRMRSAVDTASYTPAAYLQAVGGWKQRQRMAQLRTGSHWLAVETERFGASATQREQRTCHRCSSNSVDDEEHMVFDCAALEGQRWNHPSLFSSGSRSLREFMAQDPTEVAAFVWECHKACTVVV